MDGFMNVLHSLSYIISNNIMLQLYPQSCSCSTPNLVRPLATISGGVGVHDEAMEHRRSFFSKQTVGGALEKLKTFL